MQPGVVGGWEHTARRVTCSRKLWLGGRLCRGRDLVTLWGLVLLPGRMKLLAPSVSNISHSKILCFSATKTGEVKNNPPPNIFHISGFKPEDRVQVQTSWLGG